MAFERDEEGEMQAALVLPNSRVARIEGDSVKGANF
jgi:hypothetical protein